MNIENKRKHLFFAFSITILSLLLLIFSAVPTTSITSTNADENITTLSDVSTSDVRTRYLYYWQDYQINEVQENLPDNQYYDISLSNDANNNILSDSIYAWSNGVNVLNNDVSKLIFRLNLTNTEYLDDPYKVYYGEFYFDLYKVNKDGSTATRVLSLLYLSGFSNDSEGFESWVGIKQNSFSSERFGLCGGNYDLIRSDDDFMYTSYFSKSDFCSDMINKAGYTPVMCSIGYTEDTSGQLPFWGDVSKHLYFVVDNVDSTSSYFIKMNYGLVSFNSGSLTTTKCESPLCSRMSSIYNVVNEMNERHELSNLTEEMQAEALRIITDSTTEKIKVSWLERIGDTPFAQKKYDYIEIPVINNTISPSDVVTALGLETLAVGQSSCQYFKYDSTTDTYNAYYLKNVWLSSKDSNGNSMNLFLDINKSYYDYYYPFVRDGIFTNGMYEWFWSTMVVAYPEISGVDDGNLYGYFGYTSVPYTYTLNQLIYEMFDGSPNMDGVVRYFSYRENLEYSSYRRLLDEYGYGWLEKGWNAVAGFVVGSKYPADHYFFYCDGDEDNAFIGQNGADDIYDNNGAFANGVEDVVEDITNGLKTIFDNDPTKWLALGLGIIVLTWFLMFFFVSIFKIMKARQEYKNSKRHRKKSKG